MPNGASDGPKNREITTLASLIEQAIIEHLEDEIDLEAYRQRRGEETVSLEELLSKSRKGKR